MQYYQDFPVDVFVNVSSTEGVPVSIQEAISCGIPVIATAVGGNPEIVSEQNGILLSPDPQPDEIAAALLKIWDDPALAGRLRRGSRQVWQTSYNAQVNFRVFAERLKSIREER
jgi:glycosyltransferase involved in cell wall biosynthesis